MQNSVIVIGASRGFGATTVQALRADGLEVIAVARTLHDLATLRDQTGATIVVGDGRDPELARRLLAEHQPVAVVIGGGVAPHMAPIEEQTFDTLSLHWNHDVAIAFTWLQASLANPSATLRDVIVISSGAGLFGSPGSGGYAGAKATTRFLAGAASDSARRLGQTTRFTTVNPKLTHATDVGRVAVDGYARINGNDGDAAVSEPPPYTAGHAGRTIAALVTHPPAEPAEHYLLTENGLQPI